jgi:carbamoyl-phosphate synthase small subunit
LFAKRGIETHVFPADTPVSTLLDGNFNGVFLSNGPGDPATANEVVDTIKVLLEKRIPLFGICFGQQLFGRALGLKTYKLQFGHRGINQPVKDLQSGRVAITAHNHGFAVAAPDNNKFDTDFGPGLVTHRCLNDNVVEGLELTEIPAFSVQYHPEAAAGPHDAEYLFNKFVSMMRSGASS